MSSTYANLADLKSEYQITDTARDDLLELALETAARHIDSECGRRFWLDEAPTAKVINPSRKVYTDADGSHLLVKDIGSLSGLVVEIGTAGAWTDVTSSVEVEPLDAIDDGRPVTSLLRKSWPLGSGQRVRVTARWGWPAVPAAIQTAALRQASRLFKRKDSPDGIAGTAEWGIVRVTRVDPDVAGLVARYVVHGVG